MPPSARNTVEDSIDDPISQSGRNVTGATIGSRLGLDEDRQRRRLKASRKRESVWRGYLRKPSVIFFITVLAIMVLLSFVGPLFAGNPISTAHPTLVPPGAEFPLGTDQLGRDYLPWVLRGGQVSLLVGVAVAILCMTFGVVVGGLAGFYGKFADTILVKIAEFFQVIPGIVLALVAAALWGANIWLIVIILSITG